MIKGLYVHIPFCSQICSYCDFCKMVGNKTLQTTYIETLIEELRYHKDKYGHLETIYIGGGTPTSIDIALISRLLCVINETIDMNQIKEFTMEGNPNDITKELAILLKKYHVSRMSLGVQTTNEHLLKVLNRAHKKNDVISAIELLKNNGVTNINLDFIYGIPKQTKDDILKDLDFINQMKPSHISYYSLIVEENTKLLYDIGKKLIKPLEDDLISDFSELIRDNLKKQEYVHYETSNYAKQGFQSLHNLIYWNLDEYIGIGLNASSQYNQRRVKNQKLITKYIKNFKLLEEESFEPEIEFLLMGLRKINGIDIETFKQRFNKELFTIFPQLKKHINNGLLIKNNHTLKFTNLGINLANQVYIDII